MEPFRGLFTVTELADTGTAERVDPAVETSILFAMIVYGIVALAAHDLVEWLGGRRASGEPEPVGPPPSHAEHADPTAQP